MTHVRPSVGGMSLNAVSFGMNWSPLVMSTGVMMGMRAALSMFIGATVGWGLLSPWLVSHHVVATLEFSSLPVLAGLAGAGHADGGQPVAAADGLAPDRARRAGHGRAGRGAPRRATRPGPGRTRGLPL